MPRPPQAGVCIVRAEVQGDGLLITVLANTSVTRTLRSVGPSSERKFADIAEATEAVADFLREFGLPASAQTD
jgi:hypothetical protein